MTLHATSFTPYPSLSLPNPIFHANPSPLSFLLLLPLSPPPSNKQPKPPRRLQNPLTIQPPLPLTQNLPPTPMPLPQLLVPLNSDHRKLEKRRVESVQEYDV